MRRFFVYFLLQCRRALRLLPHILAVTALLAGGAGLAAVLLSADRAADESRQLALIGVVGSESSPYIRVGIDALETFDTSREELQFVFLDEETALAELRAGKLSAFFYLPDDFVESIYAGEIDPIRFVTLENAAGINTLLTAELAEMVARLMTESLSAQYGAQQYAREHLPDVDPYQVDNELVARYFSMVLTRDRLTSVKLVGLSDALSFGGYYFCAVATAFLLMLGISAASLCSRRSAELGLTLRAQGFGPLRQTLAEFAAFYLVLLPGTLLAAAAALLLLRRSGLDIPELEALSPSRLAGTLALLLLGLGAMQFFLYELVPSALGGILLQFLNAAVQGYLCGCFYPSGFFPDTLQRIGAALPAGTAMRTMRLALRGVGSGAMLVWVPVFLLLSAALRALRLRKGGAA